MLNGEQRIIKDAVGGEASAFGLLYDYYQPRIYRFVLIKVGHREEAEDLTHQVFLHAWHKISSYKPMGFPFSSWLYQIARNQVIDFYRTRKQNVPLDTIDPDALALQSNLAETTDTKREVSRVAAGIRKLKPEYQDVIIMRFVEDMAIKDVAEALGRSEGAVKLMQHRALKMLRSILDDKE